ncbi:MAG: thiamine biosynthesis lipoprotein [Myxococcota bacterium]|jgi:thiamine biosynthesis lipoprotein
MAPPTPRTRPLRAFILPALFVGVLFALLFLRREPQPEIPERHPVTVGGETMGTTWTAKAIGGSKLSPEQELALGLTLGGTLDGINESMSTWLEDSELSRFNQHDSTEPFTLSAQTLTVFEAAQTVSEQSGGAFDITIAPVVEAWGFGVDDPLRGPTDSEAAILMAAVGMEKLTIDSEAGTVARSHPDLTADLSAIAKGYGVDAVAESLEKLGYSEYLVEVGGEIRARGLNANGVIWQIGIEQPDAERGALHSVLPLEDTGMATSGDYRNYIEQGGVRISHTIDARTGRPITHTLASVTVLHDSAMMADALATAINVLGPEEGHALAESLNLPVLMLIRTAPGEFSEKTSTAFRAYRVTHPPSAQE